MNRRRDALVGAAEIVTTLNRLARNEDEWTRLTVGRLEVSPNSGATVPGETSLICDLRHPDANTLERLDNQIQEVIQAVAKQNHLEVKIERTIDAPPVYFSGELIDSVRDAAERLGYAHIDMLSGAGHDAMNLAQIVPTAMIFVPCKDGISHNEAESAKPEDLAAGAHTLLHTLLGRATRA
jgi:N-carbamoyl-L-amino-acid hydrolase